MQLRILLLCGLGLLVATGCRPSPGANSVEFGRFEGQVVAVWDEDGRHMTLREDFAFVDRHNRRWLAPAGTTVDGASIPRAFWTMVGGPFEGRYRNASVIHDVGCVEMRESWQDVHRTFYEACRAGGVDDSHAKVLYYAVYHFGPRWQPVTERRVEWRQTETGEMVQEEVVVERVVRNDPPPPTPTEIQQVAEFIVEDNPDASFIEQVDRETLRRRPRGSQGRRERSDEAAGEPRQPHERGRWEREPLANAEPNSPDAERGSREDWSREFRERRVAEGDFRRETEGDVRRPEHANWNPDDRPDRGTWTGRVAGGVEHTVEPRDEPQRRPTRADWANRSRRPQAGELPRLLPDATASESATVQYVSVSVEEQEWAAAVVRQHLEQQSAEPQPAEFAVEPTEQGFRVLVQFLQFDEQGQATTYPGGNCVAIVSSEGQVLEVLSGVLQ